MNPRRSFFSWTYLLPIILGILIWGDHTKAQTKIPPDQIKPTLTVVEWATCQGTTATGSDCTGLELFRFRRADGTLMGPYVVVLVPDPTTIKSPPWTWKPLN